MKAVVIQENIMQPDLTAEELRARWNRLKQIPQIDTLKICQPDAGGYPGSDALHSYIGDADFLFGLWVSEHVINEEFLSFHPNLKYIATLGHGWGEFDVEMTRKKNLTITNTIYGAQTIAEHTWALLMEICHNITYHSSLTKSTDWTKQENVTSYGFAQKPVIELGGQTIGIIGLGSIGYNVARMAFGFGMNVLSYNRHKKKDSKYNFIEQVSLEELLTRSDVISLNCPYSASSANMINKDTIAQMKDGAILINTARGGLIVEQDLADALHSGKLYAAGLDVLAKEPDIAGSPLLSCENAYITEHIAWLTKTSRFRAIDMAIENFKAYMEGSPVSVIN